MDEPMFDAGAVARFDQARAEAADWAHVLVEFRARLCEGGFSPRHACRLTAVWCYEQLERHSTGGEA
jgi:hypothetical protein